MPTVAAHAVPAPRIAIMHTWLATQTEGWWRYAFDAEGVPYDYISTQTAAKEDDLRSKYDVIVFAPVGRASAHDIIDGLPDVEQRDAVGEVRPDAEPRPHRLDRRTSAPAWATTALRTSRSLSSRAAC